MDEKINFQTNPPQALSDPRLHDMGPTELRDGLIALRVEFLGQNPKPWDHVRTLTCAINKACEEAPFTIQMGGYW